MPLSVHTHIHIHTHIYIHIYIHIHIYVQIKELDSALLHAQDEHAALQTTIEQLQAKLARQQRAAADSPRARSRLEEYIEVGLFPKDPKP